MSEPSLEAASAFVELLKRRGKTGEASVAVVPADSVVTLYHGDVVVPALHVNEDSVLLVLPTKVAQYLADLIG